MKEFLAFPQRLTAVAVLGGLAAFIVPSTWAFEIDVDFSGSDFQHGTVVSTQYDHVSIAAVNTAKSHDRAVIYDPSVTDQRDDDLEEPFSPQSGWLWGGTDWVTASLTSGQTDELRQPFATSGHRILMIQENATGCDDGVCDEPDDEAGGPNFLVFDFDSPMTISQLDIFDLDGNGQGEEATIAFFSTGGGALPAAYETFDDTAEATFVVSNDKVGSHGASRFFFGDEVKNVGRMVVAFTSSGAVTGLVGTTSVPEPGTLALLGVALAGMARVQRSRRST